MLTRLLRGALTILALTTPTACGLIPGGGGGESCAIGTKDCSCTTAGRCEAGLSCVKGSCVTGGSEAAASGAVSYREACLRYVQTDCAKMEACTPAALRWVYGDQQTCTARRSIYCLPQPFEGSADGTEARLRCIADLAATSCDDYDVEQPASCLPPGKRTVGQPCWSGRQCQSLACSEPEQGCGTCLASPSAGGPCEDDFDCPTSDLICENKVCLTPAGPGQPCSPTRACRFDLTCGASGSCVPAARAAGASCAKNSDCRWGRGIACNKMTGRCEPFRFARGGEACGDQPDGSWVDCELGGYCDENGRCPVVAQDGSSCAGDTLCRVDSTCAAGVCQHPPPLTCN